MGGGGSLGTLGHRGDVDGVKWYKEYVRAAMVKAALDTESGSLSNFPSRPLNS